MEMGHKDMKDMEEGKLGMEEGDGMGKLLRFEGLCACPLQWNDNCHCVSA